MNSNFVEKELRLRQDKYSVPKWQQMMLKGLNEHIQNLDEKLDHHVPKESSPPIIMVLGLPRSWTTLCVQLLYSALDIKTVTNIAARFWKAPVTGMMLSLSLNNMQRESTFASFYGKTTSPLGPHEFSYFWHHWFKMDDMPPYDPAQKDKEIDWSGFHQVLANMAGISPTPLVMKAMDAVYHLPRIYETLQRGLFIYVERNPEDIAFSLAKGRMEYYGNLDTWFSVFPLECEKLFPLPWHEQIAGQVYGLRDLHEEQLAKVDGERILRFSYEEVCNDPPSIVEMIATRLEDVFGVKVQRLAGTMPTKLTPHRTELPPELASILLKTMRSPPYR